MKQRTINFDVEDSDVEDYKYKWKYITLNPGDWSYETIVAAIINAAYPSNEMQACINNFMRTIDGSDLDDEKRTEYIEEHRELCKCRDHAKEVAKQLIAYAEENNL